MAGLDKKVCTCYMGITGAEMRVIEVLRSIEFGNLELTKQDGEVTLVRLTETHKDIFKIKL